MCSPKSLHNLQHDEGGNYMAETETETETFGCLTHNSLMLKLEAYGLSENTIKLLKSYLENRRQHIKIG
jgi:hypothetical protein